MKVALSGAYNTLDAGPSQVHEGLARGLAEKGVDVLMLSHGDREDPPHDRVEVVRVGERPSSVLEHVSVYRRAARVAEERDVDVYHTLEDQPQPSDVRTTQWVTTLPQTLRHYPRQLDVVEELGDVVLNVLARRGAKRATYTVASSPVTRDQMERWWRLSPSEVVPLGVGAGAIRTDETVGRPRRVLFPGRLTPKKGQTRVLGHLDADDLDVHLVGSRADEAYADAVLSAAPSTYHGFVSRERLAELYGSSDLAVVASYHENFGLTALEAVASGCVVVVTDACGFARFEAVQQSDAVEVVPDGRAAAERIESVSRESDSELRGRKREARSLAEEFRWSEIAGRYLDLYERI